MLDKNSHWKILKNKEQSFESIGLLFAFHQNYYLI